MVYFIVRKDGFLTVNYRPSKHFYVGNEMHSDFRRNFLSLCSKPNGRISNRNISIYTRRSGLVIPYKYLYRYALTNTFTIDNVWFNDRTYILHPDYTVFMKFKVTNEKYELLDK